MHKSAKKLALAGAGNWGKNLARNFFEMGVLHTICDVNPQLLQDCQKTFPQVNITHSFTEVCNHPEIRQIAIASPAPLHFSMAKEALEAGKDLFVEKPLCLDCDEAEQLVTLAAKNRCILMVGHLLHYHPAFQKLKELVQQGEIGVVKHIACHRLKMGHFRTQENVLWSFSPHDFSMVLSLAGEASLKSVCCKGCSFISEGIADIAITNFAFSNGLSAHIYANWIHPQKEQKLIVTGTKGILSFDDTRPWQEKLSIIRDPIAYDSGEVPRVGNSLAVYLPVKESEPLQEECLHFLQCCAERSPPKTSGSEGLRTLQALQAADKSLKEGKEIWLNIPDEKPAAYFCHPSAVVDQGAEIGEKTSVWHFSHILSGATIGAGCNIGQNVTIFPHARLGANCKVQNNVSLYAGVICEDNVFIGPSAVFTNVTNPRSEICRRGEYKSTHIGQGASIGANATILCGITIGCYSFVGAGAVVTKNTKPYSLVIGNPARQVGWMSRYGAKISLPLSSIQPLTAACPETGELYQLVGDQLQAIEA